MAMWTNSSLQLFLATNVCEITFLRRHSKPHWYDIRGLLGTTNYPLLNTLLGKRILNFKPPMGIGMGYDYKAKNLCVVWDIFRQEYRVFGAEHAVVKSHMPVTTDAERRDFWKYFQAYVANMTNDQKLKFMGYMG